MHRILITGATGNVGLEVIRSLCLQARTFEVIAGVKSITEKNVVLDQLKIKKIPFRLPRLQ